VTVLLSLADLRSRGVRFSRQHIFRLVRSQQFPAPIKLGVGEGTNAWIEAEVEEFIKSRIAARDQQTQRPKTKKARIG
jgi:prophage regulatory protein